MTNKKRITLIKKEEAESILNLTYNPDEFQELCDRFEHLMGMRSICIDSKYIYTFIKKTEDVNENVIKSKALKEYKSFYEQKIEHKEIIGAFTDNYLFIFNMTYAERFYLFYEQQKYGEEFLRNRLEQAKKNNKADTNILKLYNE